jgi:hypothetical protein
MYEHVTIESAEIKRHGHGWSIHTKFHHGGVGVSFGNLHSSGGKLGQEIIGVSDDQLGATILETSSSPIFKQVQMVLRHKWKPDAMKSAVRHLLFQRLADREGYIEEILTRAEKRGEERGKSQLKLEFKNFMGIRG